MDDGANPYLTLQDAPEYLSRFAGALELWVGIVEEQGLPVSKKTALASYCCAWSELARSTEGKQLAGPDREAYIWCDSDGEEQVHFLWQLQRLASEAMSTSLETLGISRQALANRGGNVVDLFDHLRFIDKSDEE